MREWASKLGHGAIHRLWQLLLKGLAEVHSAPMPLEAAEMALLRVIHAAELPDPGAVLEKAGERRGGRRARRPRRPRPRSRARCSSCRRPSPIWSSCSAGSKAHISQQLHDFVGLVRYAPPELVMRPTKPLSGDFAREVGRRAEGR